MVWWGWTVTLNSVISILMDVAAHTSTLGLREGHNQPPSSLIYLQYSTALSCFKGCMLKWDILQSIVFYQGLLSAVKPVVSVQPNLPNCVSTRNIIISLFQAWACHSVCNFKPAPNIHVMLCTILSFAIDFAKWLSNSLAGVVYEKQPTVEGEGRNAHWRLFTSTYATYPTYIRSKKETRREGQESQHDATPYPL